MRESWIEVRLRGASRRGGSGWTLVGPPSTGSVTRRRSRPCMSPPPRPCTAQTIHLARRSPRAAAWRGVASQARAKPLDWSGLERPDAQQGGWARVGTVPSGQHHERPVQAHADPHRSSRPECGYRSRPTSRIGMHPVGHAERSVTGGQVIHGLHRRLDHLEGDLPIRCDRQLPLLGGPFQHLLVVIPEGCEVSAPRRAALSNTVIALAAGAHSTIARSVRNFCALVMVGTLRKLRCLSRGPSPGPSAGVDDAPPPASRCMRRRR